VGSMDVGEEATTDTGKVVEARIIVDLCGPVAAAAVVVVVGVGVMAAVGRVVKKGIVHMERKTMMPPVGDRYHLPR
jgi:hypothetical protein